MAEKELIDVTLPNGSVLTNVPFGSTKDQVKNAAIKLGIAEVLDFKNDAQVKDPNMYQVASTEDQKSTQQEKQ